MEEKLKKKQVIVQNDKLIKKILVKFFCFESVNWLEENAHGERQNFHKKLNTTLLKN